MEKLTHYIKSNFLSIVLISLLIVCIAAAGISNISSYVLLLKLICSFILLTAFYFHSKTYSDGLYNFLISSGAKRIYKIFFTISAFLFLTLIYSSNTQYGLIKILNLIISFLPILVASLYIIKIIRLSDLKYYIIIVSGIYFIIFLSAIILIAPFDQSTVYEFSFNRWSHVFAGRIISFLTLIVFFIFLGSKKQFEILFFALFFLMGVITTFLTGLRTAIMGLLIFSTLAFLLMAFKKYLIKAHYIIFFLIVLFISLTFYFLSSNSTLSPTINRFENLFETEGLNFGGDSAIHTRIASYKIAWEMFSESPIIGKGLGSFNGYNNLEWTKIQKYPHNIILEILAELGIIGLLIFTVLFIVIIKSILTTHYPPPTTYYLLLTFFFSLFLAMFSKDISTQNLLWLFLVVHGIKSNVGND